MDAEDVGAKDIDDIGDAWLDDEVEDFFREDALLDAIRDAPEDEPSGKTLDLSGGSSASSSAPASATGDAGGISVKSAGAAAAAAASNGLAAAAAVIEYASAVPTWRAPEPSRRHCASSAHNDEGDSAPGLVQQEAARAPQPGAGKAAPAKAGPSKAATGKSRGVFMPWRSAVLTLLTMGSIVFWATHIWQQPEYMPVGPPQIRRPIIRNPAPDRELDRLAGNSSVDAPGKKLSGVISVQWRGSAVLSNMTAASREGNASDALDSSRSERGRRKGGVQASQLI